MTNSLGKSGLAALVAVLTLCVPVRADYVSGLDPDGDGYLALRSGPGSGFDLVRKLDPDTIVEIIDQYGVWKMVRTADGATGWADGRWIAPGQPSGAQNQDKRRAVTGGWLEIAVPPPGSAERQEVLAVARAAAEADIGFAVGLRSDTLRTFGDWAYVQGVPTTAAGNAIDWSATRYAAEMRDGFATDVVMVLMRRVDGAWAVAESIFGPTDVYWYAWREEFALPERLFFSEQEGPIPEADWTGPPLSRGPAAPDSAETVAPEDLFTKPHDVAASAWRDQDFGFTLALPDEWRVETSDQNGMHMVVALSPQDEAGVIVLAIEAGRILSPERLLETIEPMLMQNIITEASTLSKSPRSINGMEGVWARYSGTYLSDAGPLASTADAFYTTGETTGFVILTIVPDFLVNRWQPVLAEILESFRFPDIAPKPAPQPGDDLPETSAVPPAGITVEMLQTLLPVRADGLSWGVALARDASPGGSTQSPDVTARYFGFAPDGAEPFETDLELLIFEGPADRLDALFTQYRAAPGALPVPLASEAVEIASDGGEVWLRRSDGLVRIASPDKALALSFAQNLAP
jgi:hypothetical protein